MDGAGPAWAALSAQLRLEVAQVHGGAGSQVELSAADLKDFDSSALSLLLGAARHCADASIALRIDAAPPALVELARVYGVQELLQLA
jgi:phospholipid transport system transporter-binding protein